MQDAVRIIKDEHAALAAVLHGLCFLAREAETKRSPPNFQVLRAMLDYIVAFPERLHHPKEDRYLFALMLERDPQAAPLIEELQAEHRRGDEMLERLQTALLRYERVGQSDAPAFRAAADAYANFHWAHMRREEDIMLPLAEKILTEADWHFIAAAFKENDNPLFGIKPKQELSELFGRVVYLAPPPIGVGQPVVART